MLSRPPERRQRPWIPVEVIVVGVVAGVVVVIDIDLD
jgi:hypothetical protein